MKKQDISEYFASPQKNTTWITSYNVDQNVAQLMKDIYEHPDQKNIFWYLGCMSSWRWVFGITRELLDTEEDFRAHVTSKLWKSYFAFEQICRFLRNVLMHATHPFVLLDQEDFMKQRDFLANQKNIFDIWLVYNYKEYAKYVPQRETYDIKIHIFFAKLISQISLFKIISHEQVDAFCDLCYVFTLEFQKKSWK